MATAEIGVITPLHASSSSWMTITGRATKQETISGAKFSAKSGIQAKKWVYFVNRGASQYSS